MDVFIVESPSKCKTIKYYLPQMNVVASMGHIRDLSKKNLSIDIDNNFAPKFYIMTDKFKLVNNLKNAIANANTIWLATDMDMEGEAISWHLSEILNLKNKCVKRVLFNQITRSALENAISKPTTINMNVVNAQIARRIIDRLIGFCISPILWKNVSNGISAGRVQTPTLKLIIEKDKEIEIFRNTSSYKITTDVKINNEIHNFHSKYKPNEKMDAIQYINKIKNINYIVSDVNNSIEERFPQKPFITVSLQQEASLRLKMTPKKTMDTAQKLYESGKITYMRTDCPTLSSQAIGMLKNIVIEKYGKNMHKVRNFKSTGNAQNAHEAIRPTNPSLTGLNASNEENNLYNLISSRAIASQMVSAQYDITEIDLKPTKNTDSKYNLYDRVSKSKRKGYLMAYNNENQNENQNGNQNSNINGNLNEHNILNKTPYQILPSNGDKVILCTFNATEIYEKPPKRYNEASLVKAMSPKPDGIGIGRPSTYADVINKLFKHGYITKSYNPTKMPDYNVINIDINGIMNSKTLEGNTIYSNGYIIPTEIGFKTNEYMITKFGMIADYNLSAMIENQLDLIMEGRLQWTECVDKLYRLFAPIVKVEMNNNISNRIIVSSKKTHCRNFIGKDNKGNNIYAIQAKYGPVLKIGDGKNIFFVPLKGTGKTIKNINLDEAITLITRRREYLSHK